MSLELATDVVGGDRVAYIHTSDRSLFKRCRRKWHWFGKLGPNFEAEDKPIYFWFGTGIHYALEDYHGYNFYKDPRRAFQAYALACRRTPDSIPDGWREEMALADHMLEYYLDWIKHRDKLETIWMDGKPQCEVRFDIPIPFDFSRPRYTGSPFKKVVYRGTIDRVVKDAYGRMWFLDYKTCASFPTDDPDYNQQCSAYCWAGSVLYPGLDVSGFMFQHHRKTFAEPPQILSSGKLSLNKAQLTTHKLYRAACINMYGSYDAIPVQYQEFLGDLLFQETEDKDRYIKRENTYRGLHRTQAEGTKIMLEIEDMLDPNLPLYPNSTRDCAWDCAVRSSCLALDDGSDWEGDLQLLTRARVEENLSWRQNLPDPQELQQSLHLVK